MAEMDGRPKSVDLPVKHPGGGRSNPRIRSAGPATAALAIRPATPGTSSAALPAISRL